jgi:hypothetical protein
MKPLVSSWPAPLNPHLKAPLAAADKAARSQYKYAQRVLSSHNVPKLKAQRFPANVCESEQWLEHFLSPLTMRRHTSCTEAVNATEKSSFEGDDGAIRTWYVACAFVGVEEHVQLLR